MDRKVAQIKDRVEEKAYSLYAEEEAKPKPKPQMMMALDDVVETLGMELLVAVHMEMTAARWVHEGEMPGIAKERYAGASATLTTIRQIADKLGVADEVYNEYRTRRIAQIRAEG